MSVKFKEFSCLKRGLLCSCLYLKKSNIAILQHNVGRPKCRQNDLFFALGCQWGAISNFWRRRKLNLLHSTVSDRDSVQVSRFQKYPFLQIRCWTRFLGNQKLLTIDTIFAVRIVPKNKWRPISFRYREISLSNLYLSYIHAPSITISCFLTFLLRFPHFIIFLSRGALFSSLFIFCAVGGVAGNKERTVNKRLDYCSKLKNFE